MRARVQVWARKASQATWLSGALFAFLGANDDNGCGADVPASAARAECQVASDCSGDPGIDCVGAWACDAGQCAFECGGTVVATGCYGDADCGAGLVCNASDVCNPPPGCDGDEACADVCYGECVRPDPIDPVGCTHSGECPDDHYCTTEAGVCDSDCPEGMSCPAVCHGECKPRDDGAICYDDSACQAGQYCDFDPCVFPEAHDAGAGDRMACGGVCADKVGCNGPAECAPGEVCTCAPWEGDAPPPGNGLVPCFLECQPSEGRCDDDSDCRDGQLCQNGACTETQRECYADSECPVGWACTQHCDGYAMPPEDDSGARPYCPSYCEPQGGTCADTGVTCGAGETCVNECYWVCPECECAPGDADCRCAECHEECRSGCVPSQGACDEALCPEGTHCGCPDGTPTPYNGLYYCDEKCVPDVPACWSDRDCGDGYYCQPSDCTMPEPCADPESCGANDPAMPPACEGTCQPRQPEYDCKSDENCIGPDGQRGFCRFDMCEAWAVPCSSDDPNCGAPPPEQTCYGWCVYDAPVQCDPTTDSCPDGTHCADVGNCSADPAGFMPCMVDYQCVPDQVACQSDCDCDPALACNEGVCQRMGRMNLCEQDQCTGDDQCPDGEYCAIDYSQPVCDCYGCPCSIPRGTCEPRPDDGSCDVDSDCEAGAVCTFYYPPCAPPPEDSDFAPPACEPIGVCEAPTCKVGGCSGEICSERDDLTSTCEWYDYYECYRYALCDYGADGVCGWQKTEDYVACMERYAGSE